MLKSETIGKLAEALSKAQGEMSDAAKDSSNPFFKSKYADLASVRAACRKEFAQNGLSVVQLPTVIDGKLVLEYALLHSSGEYISSGLEMNPTKNDPQGIGSAITYARRYTLAALAGVATEDDDGNAASDKNGNGNHADNKKPVSFRRDSAAGNSPQDVHATGTPKAAEPATGARPVPAVAPVVEGADCIDQGQATNLAIEFRNALPKAMSKQADELLHDWLRVQNIKDVTGKPSKLAIKKASFYEVREAAVEYAKTYRV